ncbi:alpha/beta fold hydrolase [Glaciimonas sp. PAMC28666]|uniref:alpha/beta hydrolase family protein n=1 Tax=Glaciimonas sp. PAMC28666 TaxID=2807626 RepID=UPI001966CDF1|nr:alpha/beta fold hydrolase [Glaciimonas sp. PAMC28666]QRX83462.1 alpha/beta fold hydrolase [Glaciimonas sp. PAMC28666]
MSRLLDALLVDAYWGEHIVGLKIGALGHSAGGFSVLALAGGVADPQQMLRHCATTDDDRLFCQLGRDPNGLARGLAFDSGEIVAVAKSAQPSAQALERGIEIAAAIDFDVRDERVRAVFAMAPIGLAFTPDSLRRINVPLQIVTAQHDMVLTPKYHGDWLRARLPQAMFEEVANAGHFVFMTSPLTPLLSEAGDPGENPPGFDRDSYLLRLEQQVEAFFDTRLL